MIEMVIDARRKDLGGFEVGRILPFHARRMIGPFTCSHIIGRKRQTACLSPFL